jgi:hypothetical protein
MLPLRASIQAQQRITALASPATTKAMHSLSISSTTVPPSPTTVLDLFAAAVSSQVLVRLTGPQIIHVQAISHERRKEEGAVVFVLRL